MSKHWITKDQYHKAFYKAEKTFANFLKTNEVDFWVGIEIDGEHYDLNLWQENDGENAYCTIHPTVLSDDGLKRQTIGTEYIRMITLERHGYE